MGDRLPIAVALMTFISIFFGEEAGTNQLTEHKGLQPGKGDREVFSEIR